MSDTLVLVIYHSCYDAGCMESACSVYLYEQSVETKNIMYNPYAGDSDSKAYRAVMKAKPCGEDYQIDKKECIGYIQEDGK